MDEPVLVDLEVKEDPDKPEYYYLLRRTQAPFRSVLQIKRMLHFYTYEYKRSIVQLARDHCDTAIWHQNVSKRVMTTGHGTRSHDGVWGYKYDAIIEATWTAPWWLARTWDAQKQLALSGRKWVCTMGGFVMDPPEGQWIVDFNTARQRDYTEQLVERVEEIVAARWHPNIVQAAGLNTDEGEAAHAAKAWYKQRHWGRSVFVGGATDVQLADANVQMRPTYWYAGLTTLATMQADGWPDSRGGPVHIYGPMHTEGYVYNWAVIRGWDATQMAVKTGEEWIRRGYQTLYVHTPSY